jgi:hypothetical protein
MILKFDNGAPIVEGSPSELSEVIALLNGGSLRVNIVPKITVTAEVVNAPPAEIKEPGVWNRGQSPTEAKRTAKPNRPQSRSGQLPRIPHSEDAWLAQQKREGTPRRVIIEALRSRGYPDVTAGDVNNRMTIIRRELEKTAPAATPEPEPEPTPVHVPTPTPKQKYLETEEETDDVITSMNATGSPPFEIARVLSRRTLRQWTGTEIVARLEAIKRSEVCH